MFILFVFKSLTLPCDWNFITQARPPSRLHYGDPNLCFKGLDPANNLSDSNWCRDRWSIVSFIKNVLYSNPASEEVGKRSRDVAMNSSTVDEAVWWLLAQSSRWWRRRSFFSSVLLLSPGPRMASGLCTLRPFTGHQMSSYRPAGGRPGLIKHSLHLHSSDSSSRVSPFQSPTVARIAGRGHP